MATLKHPLLSQLSGKLGNLVIYQLNGKTVLREKPKWKTAYKATPHQKMHQLKFKEVYKILRPLKILLDFGFSEFIGGNRKGIHLAMSHAMKQACYLEGEQVKINFNSLLLSSGPIEGVDQLAVEKPGNKILRLTWESQGNYEPSRESDLTWIVVYNPSQGLVEEFKGKAYRRTQVQEVEVSPRIDFNGLFIYVSFYRNFPKNRVKFSDSVCFQLE
ncbi:hypothetical protein D0X99_19680 [Algoriphagus lacus]|uniref:Uncharacterized protein n=1 Tax=Algoriphagus lacus TaxID=2056311 RepID=A0A418PLN6_9BACT|nr:DUF6266 family protein [Algoriphagus lacus]RIW12179.1 hypothetical protein D0X99_19680 [Algoriphagus lacus]